jgi:CheY-like chemotaxis protein
MSRRLVLFVEDSRDLAANLEIACAAIRDVEIRVAMGAGQAWEILEQVSADDWVVIVTDIRLPDANGMDLIRRVRQHERIKNSLVVAVSGDGDPDIPAQLEALHVSAFFRKPYSPVTLRNHLETLLAARPSVSGP